MIQELLQQLDLSKKETELFLALFEYGKTTPARLAKATKINRSTVYAVLEKLKEKGLVVEDMGSKIIYVSPASADDVEDMFQRQQEKLKEKKKIAAQLAEELERMPQSKTYSVPKIRFIAEADLEEYLYKQMEKWNESARRNEAACWGFQDHSFAEQYQSWIDWAWKKYKLQVNLVSNDSKIEKQLKEKFDEKRSIRFGGAQLDFTASTWIMGDYLIMIVTRQHPFYLVEIHDGVLAHNMREIFKKDWK